MKFSELAKANVDFYNEHPTAHAVFTATATVVFLVGLRYLPRLAKPTTINVYYPKS
jgi:hypothetical protein